MRANHLFFTAAAVAWGGTIAPARAAITAFFQPVTITQAAINDDNQLASMQCWDIMVTCDGDWASAGMQVTLPAGFSFYNHALGGDTKPNPALLPIFPSMTFDTYVTAPSDTGSSGAPSILGGFPESEPLSMSGNRLSVSWGNLTVDPPGTSQIARLTFPQGVLPAFHPESSTSQVNPQSSTPLSLFGPFFAAWVTDADGSWHVGANWNTGSPPNGNWIVRLDVGGPAVRTITHSQGTTSVQRIDAQEHIRVTGGKLIATSGMFVQNGLTIDGGTVGGRVIGPTTVGPAGGVLEAATVDDINLPGGAPLLIRFDLGLSGNASFNPGASMRLNTTQSIGTGAPTTVGTVHFQDGGAIEVNGGATLVVRRDILMRGSGGAIGARIPKTPGFATVLNEGTIRADVDGASLTLAADASTNRGTLAADAGATLHITGLLDAEAGAIGGDGAVRAEAGLNVTGTIGKPGTGPLRVNGNLTLPASNAIDLLGGGIVNDYAGPSPLSAIRARIISGYSNNTWTGTGINSSTAAADDNLGVGYAEASALFATFPATFMGESIDDTTLLVRLVRNGDANLDGSVNLDDFNRLAGSFGVTGSALWDDGDFNYDGAVNLIDFNLLASNFGFSAAGTGAPTQQDWSALASRVPEPVAAHALGIVALLARRRRHGRKILLG